MEAEETQGLDPMIESGKGYDSVNMLEQLLEEAHREITEGGLDDTGPAPDLRDDDGSDTDDLSEEGDDAELAVRQEAGAVPSSDGDHPADIKAILEGLPEELRGPVSEAAELVRRRYQSHYTPLFQDIRERERRLREQLSGASAEAGSEGVGAESPGSPSRDYWAELLKAYQSSESEVSEPVSAEVSDASLPGQPVAQRPWWESEIDEESDADYVDTDDVSVIPVGVQQELQRLQQELRAVQQREAARDKVLSEVINRAMEQYELAQRQAWVQQTVETTRTLATDLARRGIQLTEEDINAVVTLSIEQFSGDVEKAFRHYTYPMLMNVSGAASHLSTPQVGTRLAPKANGNDKGPKPFAFYLDEAQKQLSARR